MKRASGHAYDEILGATFLFLEAQRSGALSDMPGGNRIPWRRDQLLQDGSDVSLDLSGGYYEAGSACLTILQFASTFRSCLFFAEGPPHATRWCAQTG